MQFSEHSITRKTRAQQDIDSAALALSRWEDEGGKPRWTLPAAQTVTNHSPESARLRMVALIHTHPAQDALESASPHDC
jgi:hypothetical protein